VSGYSCLLCLCCCPRSCLLPTTSLETNIAYMTCPTFWTNIGRHMLFDNRIVLQHDIVNKLPKCSAFKKFLVSGSISAAQVGDQPVLAVAQRVPTITLHPTVESHLRKTTHFSSLGSALGRQARNVHVAPPAVGIGLHARTGVRNARFTWHFESRDHAFPEISNPGGQPVCARAVEAGSVTP
jgi:hypothetical protein